MITWAVDISLFVSSSQPSYDQLSSRMEGIKWWTVFGEESWDCDLIYLPAAAAEDILEIWESQHCQQQDNKPKCDSIKTFSFQCKFLYLDILTNQPLTKVSPNCIELFLCKSLQKLSTDFIGMFIQLFLSYVRKCTI